MKWDYSKIPLEEKARDKLKRWGMSLCAHITTARHRRAHSHGIIANKYS